MSLSDELLKDFGKYLQKLRLNAGYKSQERFAKALNISKSAIGNYEAGRNLPDHKYWKNILVLLKCKSLDELFKQLLKDLKKDTEIDMIIKRIRRIYNIPEGKRKIVEYVDVLEKAYNIKTPSERKQSQR